MRLSIDCKATVKIGEHSLGGKTRADSQAADHDMGCETEHTPFGGTMSGAATGGC
jgi:hypothetical protein